MGSPSFGAKGRPVALDARRASSLGTWVVEWGMGACPVGCCLLTIPCVSEAKCLSAFLPADVDECANANGGCEGPCCNTVGGFYCRCLPGYQLQGDGKTCQGKTHLLDRVGGESQGQPQVRTRS